MVTRKGIMKIKLLFASILFTAFAANSAMTPAEALKNAPEAICAGHNSPSDCQAAIKGVLFASYQFSSLNETCESSNDAVKAKMNDQIKAQCAAAKDAVKYLETLNP